MIRVDADELDNHPDSGGCVTLRGEPFDGVAYATEADGRPVMEWTFRRGRAWGPQRAWHPDGRLAEASYAVAGQAHGVTRSWRPDGGKAAVEVCEYGVRVRARRWDDRGRVTEDYTLDASPAAAASRRLIDSFRRRYGALVEAEDIPAEFLHATDDDWR